MIKRKKPNPSILNYVMNMDKIPLIIEGDVRKKDSVIYGRRAMNKQVHGFLKAKTYDYDIYDKTPKKTASLIQNLLDKKVAGGKDVFYSKPAQHEGTHKVMHRGRDLKKGTEDDFEIADYTEMPNELKTVRKDGLRYEKLNSIIEVKKQILKDKESAYRHEKDKADLRSIKASQRLRR